MRTSIVAILAILTNVSGLVLSVSTIVSIVLFIMDRDPKIWIPITSFIATFSFALLMLIGLHWKKES